MSSGPTFLLNSDGHLTPLCRLEDERRTAVARSRHEKHPRTENGYEVARQILRQRDRPPRLIALTGYGQPEDRQRSLEAGFDEHVVKPIDPFRLAQLVTVP